MRGLIDFYRRNPAVLVVVVVLGLALSVVVATQSEGGAILPIALLALLGIVVGLAIAWRRERRGVR